MILFESIRDACLTFSDPLSIISRESPEIRAVKKILNDLPREIKKAREEGRKWVYVILPPFFYPPDKQPPKIISYREIASLLMRRNGSCSPDEPIVLSEQIGEKKCVGVLFPVQYCEICGGTADEPCWKCRENVQKVPSLTQRPVRRYRVLAISTEES